MPSLKAALVTVAGAAAWPKSVILAWVYYSARVFFLGAELTHVYATTYGSRAGISDEAGGSATG